jgi:hypothetical protein
MLDPPKATGRCLPDPPGFSIGAGGGRYDGSRVFIHAPVLATRLLTLNTWFGGMSEDGVAV